jgi:transcriptional regulator with XRE-family HTH domain
MKKNELMKYPTSFKIKYLRAAKGYSEREFAKLVGCSVNALNYWELGERNPSFRFLVRISIIIGVPLDFFIDVEQYKSKNNTKILENELNL